MLKGEANYWWEAKRAIEEKPVIPWERFTALFLEKFIPYHVDIEENKTRHFQLGLRPWIQNRVAVLEISNYATLVHKASIVESGNDLYPNDKGGVKRKFSINAGNSERKFDGNKNKKPFVKREDRKMDKSRFGHKDSRGNETKFRTPQTANLLQGRPPLPDCKTCRRKHSGQCRQENVTCYVCGKKGHYSGNYKDKVIICHNCERKGHYAREYRQPQRESEVPRLMAPPTQDNHNLSNANIKPTARTFNMTLKDAITDNDVIAGMLLVNSTKACVLIDSGATRSFISENFVYKLGLELKSLNEDMMVEIVNQEVISVNRVCPNCTIEIQGKPFVVDLILFKLGKFDVILGMDWLTRYDAQINFRIKRVSLKSPDNKSIILRG
ncbi:uncharacterized protein LOC141660849 [Apium graveolens]|uniref:uncharacterized protein LOC141660849 n=1 Tax=Apium graveolens TaxID=4045 RepID=UPI003D794FFE